MDYVFLDTSIFEQNNFLEGGRINQLLRLSEEGELAIVLTKLTRDELISRFRKNIKASEGPFNAFRSKNRIYRNLPSRKDLFEPFDEEKSVKEFVKTLDEKLLQAKVEVIPYPTLDISEVFDKYFTMAAPFGEGQKKDEFPDAFVMVTLEKWCEKYGRKCYVLSKDGDMNGYVSPHLNAVPDYEEFLDDFLRGIKENKDLIEKSLQYINSNLSEIQSAVSKWLLENLDDVTKYSEEVNYLDVDDIDIKKHTVTFDEPEIISVDGLYGGVECELEATVNYLVTLTIPDESMGSYEDRYGGRIYFESTTTDVEKEQRIKVAVSVDVSTDDGEVNAYGLDVTEINEGKDLVILDDYMNSYWAHRYK